MLYLVQKLKKKTSGLTLTEKKMIIIWKEKAASINEGHSLDYVKNLSIWNYDKINKKNGNELD